MIPPDRRFVLAAAAGLALAPAAHAATAMAQGDVSLGRPSAKVKLVEYASASCPHCAAFNNEVFGPFRKAYIDTGKVHYTLKEMLTPPEEVAAAGFLIARCRGPARYFPTLDLVFRRQEELFHPGGLLAVAQAAGLGKAQAEACVSDKAALAAMNARVQQAVDRDGVESTPTFFLDGRKAHEGNWAYADLTAAVDAALRGPGPATTPRR
ncbi:DsbA family protein [Phenylobacterium sp.]|uniref:DsbA family protein n=1 Tax=Phenylobacterium sp. TaxID=1871053 RepID=UPI002F3F74F7